MAKSLRDLLLDVSRALPAQNTNANSTAIDLKQVLPDTLPEHFEFQVSVPATTTATGQTITITIQDSADNSSFADVTGAAFTQSTTTADIKSIALQSKQVRRYIRYLGTVVTGPQVVGVSMTGVKKSV